MATEALATERTAEGHVEGAELTDDVIDIDKESCPESKDLEGKDEGKIKAEDSAVAETHVTESDTAIISEEKQQDNRNDPAEGVKTEEAVVDKGSDPLNGDAVENAESSKQEADPSVAESKKEADFSAAVDLAAEVVDNELKSQVKVTDSSEPLQPSSEVLTEESEATLTRESEYETSREPAVPAAAAEEVNIAPEVAVEEAIAIPEVVDEDMNAIPEAAAEEVIAVPEAADEDMNAIPGAAAEEANAIPEAIAEGVNAIPEAVVEEANAITEVAYEDVNAIPEAATEEADAIPEAIAEEVNVSPEALPVEVGVTEELLHGSSVSVIEPSVVSGVTEPARDVVTTAGVKDTAEASKDETIKLEENNDSQRNEPPDTDLSKLDEISGSVPEAAVSESAAAVTAEDASIMEIKEEGRKMSVTEDVPNVPQLTEGNQKASASAEESVPLDANPPIETAESLAKPNTEVEEMQEMAVSEEQSKPMKTNAVPGVTEVTLEGSGIVENVEDTKQTSTEGPMESLKDLDFAVEVSQVSSEGEKASEGVGEKKDESLEGEKPTLFETSRGIEVEQGKNSVNTEAESLASEKAAKNDETTPADSAKDAGEAPRAEAPTKSSQRQSNSLLSKMKQSIVKVKKAIVGKSPSSKTVSGEGKDEVKAK